MKSLVKSVRSWLVICLAACLVAACAALAVIQPGVAYAGELAAGEITTQALDQFASVTIAGVNGGSSIYLTKGAAAQSVDAGDGTVAFEWEASGKIKVTLNNATIGATASSPSYRLSIVQQWIEGASCPVELVVNGTNTITVPSNTSARLYGISFGNSDNVTISGSGSLTFSGIYMTPFSWGKSSTKTSIDESGTLTINGPTINSAEKSVGKRKNSNNSEALSVVMKAGKLSCPSVAADSYVQSGGTVEAAVDANVFKISGGTLVATSKDWDAISVMSSMKVTGGKITAKGSQYAIYIGTSAKASVKAACIKSVSGYLGKGVSFKVAGSAYKVTACDRKAKKFTVTLTSGANKKKLVVSAAKIGGTTYKVTAVGAKALANKSKLSTLVLGANVSKIGASALSGSKKAKAITVKSTKLTAKRVKGSLKGSSVAKVKAPAKKVSAYQKFFTKSNAGKAAKVVKI